MTEDPARALLDSQIHELNSLGMMARSTYSSLATLPTIPTVKELSPVLADLCVTRFRDLNAQLGRAEPFLLPGEEPFTVPAMIPVEVDTATEGAFSLLVQVRACIDAEIPDDPSELSEDLSRRWKAKIPSWIKSAPRELLLKAEGLVRREIQRSVERLTENFTRARFSPVDPPTTIILKDGCYRVGSEFPRKLEATQQKVLNAFLSQPAMNLKELQAVTVVDRPQDVLKGLAESFPEFAPAIHIPSKRGAGGYAVRIVREK